MNLGPDAQTFCLDQAAPVSDVLGGTMLTGCFFLYSVF
jgi:hypothetical protein